jgi:hypothetical protein
VLQTRLPDHEVLQAVLHADPGRIVDAERARRALLGFPPTVALASVAGPGAGAFVDSLTLGPGSELLGPSDGSYLVRSPDPVKLAEGLATGTRPSARVRVHVDPPRI